MAARPAPRHSRGFSVVEVMVVVAILGIVAAVAAPNMGAMIRTQRLKTAAFDVYSSLSFARSEAIKRNTTVTILPSSPPDWSKGWEIRDGNGNVLRQQSGWDQIQSNGPAFVRFNSAGRLTSAVADIALTAPYVSTKAGRCVMLDASGRAVTREGPCPGP